MTTNTIRIAEREKKIIRDRLRPPPRLTVAEWANRFRMLSAEASFRVGPYSTDDAPYQREPMEAISDPRVRQVVCMWGSQLGKTECFINNVVGYYIDQDPSPILVLQPTLEMGEAWSKDRLAPMLRDTPRLRGKIADSKSRDSGNTILHKSFPGGHITIAGANSPAGLASRPIRILLEDEIDRYSDSAGSEGDPTAIAESRTATFPNVKIIKVSSPTIPGSPIWRAWEASDQRSRWWPCTHCGHEQILEFGGKETPFGLKWDRGFPNTAHYVCKACQCVIEEVDKLRMDRDGRWIAEAESDIPGFRLNALYSHFFSWSRLVERWMRDAGDPLKLRSFVNTILNEPWEEGGEQLDEHVLASHCHPFPRGDDPENPQSIVPHGVGVLTRSVDVQGDRLETTVWGWGDEEEAWRVDFELIPGDPATPAPWKELAARIGRTYRHESGATVPVSVTFVDTGGHHTKQAYDFCRGRAGQRVFAIKGSSLQEGVPLLQGPNRNKIARVIMYMVGSFTGKESLMRRLLKVVEPGPSYIHLPDDIDPQHLDQFLNEKLMSKIVAGRIKRAWVRKGPNEQIDLYVYANAALHSLGAATLKALGALAKKYSDFAAPEATKDDTNNEPSPPRPRKLRQSRWVNGWKDW